MDPLSIAAAAVGTTKVLYKASSTIYDFIHDAKIVDKQLENLRAEFDSTARVLEVVRVRLRNPIHLMHARSQAQDHQGFLDIALASIQECDNASSEVIAKIEAIGEGPTWLKSRTMRQVQYKRAQKDILRANTRIRDQKQNLQLLIQMLDVLLTHQSNALLTEKVLPPLSSLQLLIDKASSSRTEVYVHPTENGTSLALTTNRFVQDAGPAVPMAVDGQDAGEDEDEEIPATDPAIPIAVGIQNANEHEDEETTAADPAVSTADNGPDVDEDGGGNEGTPEDQEDVRMIQAFQAQAAELLDGKQYALAEKAFLNCLKMYEVLPIDSLPVSLMVQAQLGLATACMHQEKWDQAKELFQFLVSSDGDGQAQSLYHLAQIYLAEHEFDSAYTACLEARTKFQTAEERSHCTALLVLIAQTNEDKASATIYAAGLLEDGPDWSSLPFYRFTAKGHGLSIEGEKEALAYIESRADSAHTSHLAYASLDGNTAAVKLVMWQGAPLDETYFLLQGLPPVTPLMVAARGGHLKIVRILLDAGADADIGCRGHRLSKRSYSPVTRSALFYAVQSKNDQITRAILEALTPNEQEYLAAVEIAMYFQAIGPLETLLAHQSIRELLKEKKQGLLWEAVCGSKLLVVRQLLAAKLFTVDSSIIDSACNAVEEGMENSAAVYKELTKAAGQSA